MKKPVLHSAALMLLVFVGMSALGNKNTPFSVVVITPINGSKTYSTSTAPNGSLFGGLMRLNKSDQGFNFNYTPTDDFGPMLISVNGLKNDSSHYWALLSGSKYLPLGMGCYLPAANEVITLKYSPMNQDHLKSHSDL